MRKAQKKQVEDFIKLLSQAHEEIKRAVETKKNDLSLDLLEQCQEGAIKLGELIEHAEGEGVAAIPILESYCELTYQIHEEVGRGQAINAKEVYNNLHRSLTQLEYSISNDIKVQKEAVFLPCKASMWDSLENVWKAAAEDPDYDAYVIPIPYYDVNPDRSFGEFHYEGDQFPPYVPITHYESYPFEERHPDMIFIHNPYDEHNFVTSVHPFFYSKNIKQYTDQLIYIPYFVLDEIKPEEKEKVESMQHFCTVSGVLNADKVIVQSEDMRQIYINVLTDAMGNDIRKYWESKILGLGSPKYEKVITTKKEEVETPEGWLKIIQKPDGDWKKIVLYNTSVGALLKYSDQILEKMESVFQIFKDKQSDVVLLWRPHPLIKATIESMRPQLWTEYRKMVEQYKEQGWGIYDDSADLNRAVAISDAYYGDESSIVQLYRKTGKPIMMQNVDIKEYEKVAE